MKRRQFSIRLLLLLVALIALLISWRQALWQVERSDRLKSLRSDLSRAADRLYTFESIGVPESALELTKTEMERLKAKIADLHPGPTE
jgi:hypothetical protein